MTGMVDCLKRHATGESSITDDGNAFGDSPLSRATAMPSAAEMEVLAWPAPKWSNALCALEVTRHPVLLAQNQIVEPAGDQFGG